MDKKQFEMLVTASETLDEESGALEANKVLNKAITDLGKLDINRVDHAHSVIEKIVGKGELGGKVGNGTTTPSIASFDGIEASANSFAIAFLKVLVAAIKAKAINTFFDNPDPAKEKVRKAGNGSPARGSSPYAGRY